MKNILTGANFAGYTASATGTESFQAFAPATNQFLVERFTLATEAELAKVLHLSQQAFPLYRSLPATKRAFFLDAIAEEIMALGDVLIERCVAETALPPARISGERGRTCNQLKMFARLLRDGWWVDARIDTADAARQPVPRPNIRRMLIPIGPVAVFGASNFPLAFSTAGGDTASALAAGCPVIVKAHSSHPGTNELVSSAIIKAAQKTGMPEGVFSSVYLSHADVLKLVQHPAIKAVGFTGSREVGMRLVQSAASRPDPIPVYAEMSAVNPVVLLEGALQAGSEKLAKDLAASITVGLGQFCTNPGLVVMRENETSVNFLKHLAQQMAGTAPGTMLNRNIFTAFKKGVDARGREPAIQILSQSGIDFNEDRHEAQPIVHTVKGEAFLANKTLADEIFGPASLVVLCKNEDELHAVLKALEGQLTATVHATERDKEMATSVVDIITQKAGRVIYGGYPTGVEVCHSMHHGGPFPSTTDARSTSVGSAAIYRFVRPVAYQDFPEALLPEALQKANPLNILRLVDGEWTTKKIEG